MTPWMTKAVYETEGRTVGLQFGHGGDAVDDTTMTTTAGAPAMLQFGHGGDAVDDKTIARLDSGH